jgi:hypothetical protein
MDANQLASLRSMREIWKERFELGKPNSIATQLCRLTLNVQGFEVFQEAVALSPDAEDGGKQLNGMVFRLLTDSFLDSFMSSIRRLIDDDTRSNSLVRLLMDMHKHRAKFSRELILESEGVAYDWAELTAIEQAEFSEQLQRGETYSHGGSYIGSSDQSRDRHEAIDKLSGVTESNRKPTDRIQQDLFERLREYIVEPCTKVKNHVDQYIAHAPREEHIKPVEPILVKDLHHAHQVLCEVAGFLSLHFLKCSQYSFFVQPSGYAFMFLEKPLCPKTHHYHLEQKLQDLESKFRKYSEWHPDMQVARTVL